MTGWQGRASQDGSRASKRELCGRAATASLQFLARFPAHLILRQMSPVDGYLIQSEKLYDFPWSRTSNRHRQFGQEKHQATAERGDDTQENARFKTFAG